MRPRSLLCTSMAVAADAVFAGVAVEVAALLLLFEPPPHPATASRAAREAGRRKRERFMGSAYATRDPAVRTLRPAGARPPSRERGCPQPGPRRPGGHALRMTRISSGP